MGACTHITHNANHWTQAKQETGQISRRLRIVEATSEARLAEMKERMHQVLSRASHAPTARCLRTWRERCAEARRRLRTVQHAASRFSQPLLAAALREWHAATAPRAAPRDGIQVPGQSRTAELAVEAAAVVAAAVVARAAEAQQSEEEFDVAPTPHDGLTRDLRI